MCVCPTEYPGPILLCGASRRMRDQSLLISFWSQTCIFPYLVSCALQEHTALFQHGEKKSHNTASFHSGAANTFVNLMYMNGTSFKILIYIFNLVLICISLITRESEHLFMFPGHLVFFPSIEFSYSCLVSVERFFIFLLFNSSSLYILGINP